MIGFKMISCVVDDTSRGHHARVASEVLRLGNAVTGIDHRNVGFLVKAVLHASGQRQFPR